MKSTQIFTIFKGNLQIKPQVRNIQKFGETQHGEQNHLTHKTNKLKREPIKYYQ